MKNKTTAYSHSGRCQMGYNADLHRKKAHVKPSISHHPSTTSVIGSSVNSIARRVKLKSARSARPAAGGLNEA